MANRIQILRSSVAGARPPASTYQPGELFLNFADQVIGYIDASRNPVDIRSGGVTYSATAPATPAPKQGDLWYKTAQPVGLFVYTGQAWIATTPDLPTGVYLPRAGGTLTGKTQVDGKNLEIVNADGSAQSALNVVGVGATQGTIVRRDRIGFWGLTTNQAEILSGRSADMIIGIVADANNPVPWPPAATDCRIYLRGNRSPNIGNGAVNIYPGASGGVALAANGTSWTAISDEREKNIVDDISGGLAAIAAMRPIRFRYKNEAADAPMRVGLSAQSVHTVIPEAVQEIRAIGADGKLENEARLSLAMTEVIPHMIAAIKELAAEVAALKTGVTP